MTVIAWDGKTLAADKQSTNCGYASTVTKIYRVPGGVVGLAGNAPHAMALLDWFMNGMKPEQWPKPFNDDYASALFVAADGQIHKYAGDCGPFPERIESKSTAIGCGRDYALAAMYLGKSAFEAVQVACALDVSCGQGIDTLTLEQT